MYTDGTEEDTVSTTVTGTVQSVDDNEITLSIGGGMMQGDAPEKPDGDSTGSDSGNGDSDSVPAKPEGDGGDGYCNVYISKDSTWTVTGDSTITNLSSVS